MNAHWKDTDTSIAHALLGECGVLAKAPANKARASFPLQFAPGVGATAVVEASWLRIDAPLQPPTPEGRSLSQRAAARALATDTGAAGLGAWTTATDAARLVAWNTKLSGGAKLALVRARGAGISRGGLEARGGLGLCLRAEVALDRDDDLARRVRDACAGVAGAAGSFAALAGGGATAALPMLARDELPSASAPAWAAGDSGAADPAEIAARCEESGWAFTSRRDGQLAVDLDVPGSFVQASISTGTDGQIVVSAEPESARQRPVPECEAALCTLLLRAAGVVRMARAATRTTAGGFAAGFEIVFATVPAAAEIHHALSALSIACRIAGREATALGSSAVLAREYLSRDPWSLGLWTAWAGECGERRRAGA